MCPVSQKTDSRSTTFYLTQKSGNNRYVIPKRNTEHVHTDNMEHSVLDVTMDFLNFSQDIDPQARGDNAFNDSSLFVGPPNQVIYGNVVSASDRGEMPSFLDDSARLSEIEHAHGDGSFSRNLPFGGSFEFGKDDSVMRSVCDDSLHERISEQSMLQLQQDRANAGPAPSLDESFITCGYSFNETPVVDRRCDGDRSDTE